MGKRTEARASSSFKCRNRAVRTPSRKCNTCPFGKYVKVTGRTCLVLTIWHIFPQAQALKRCIRRPLRSRYSSALPAACEFTMRFISFVIAGATLTFLNTYAYSMPVKMSMSSSDSAGNPNKAWCAGHTERGCHLNCLLQGFPFYACLNGYVWMLSYKFYPALTCKP